MSPIRTFRIAYAWVQTRSGNVGRQSRGRFGPEFDPDCNQVCTTKDNWWSKINGIHFLLWKHIVYFNIYTVFFSLWDDTWYRCLFLQFVKTDLRRENEGTVILLTCKWMSHVFTLKRWASWIPGNICYTFFLNILLCLLDLQASLQSKVKTHPVNVRMAMLNLIS